MFWQYRQWSAEELAQLDGFLTNFDKELRALLVELTLEANYRLLCEKIGTCVHPSLVERKKSTDFKQLAEEGYGERFVIFQNHRVDVATLKLLSYVLSVVKINSLKFSNNNLIEDELKAVGALISKDGKHVSYGRVRDDAVLRMEPTISLSAAAAVLFRYGTTAAKPKQSDPAVLCIG